MVQIIRERKVVREVSYALCFDWLTNGQRTDGGFSIDCDANGVVDESKLCPPGLANYRACCDGTMRGRDGSTVSTGYIREYDRTHVEPAVARCEACGGEATMDRHCGAFVCSSCDNHLGLARCYCGWSSSGRDGCQELIELGETIDAD